MSDEAQQGKPKSGRVVGNLALVAGSVVLTLGLIEIGLRIAGWGQVTEYLPNPAWGYLMRPSQEVYNYGHPVRINALGLRGPEVASPKPAGVTRVVFVGDSVTYGGGHIPEEDLFTRVFEAGARSAGKNVEVVSIAAPGWGPTNWRGYIERNGLHQADRVVLILPECDLARPFTRMEMHGFKASTPSLRILATVLKLRDVFSRHSYGASDLEATAATNLQAVRFLEARAGEGALLVVFVPSASRQHIARYTRYWPPFESAVSSPLDLRSALIDNKYFMDGVHFNKEGHALVGKALVDRIVPTLK